MLIHRQQLHPPKAAFLDRCLLFKVWTKLAMFRGEDELDRSRSRRVPNIEIRMDYLAGGDLVTHTYRSHTMCTAIWRPSSLQINLLHLSVLLLHRTRLLLTSWCTYNPITHPYYPV